ncbi:GrpE-domain-containing protein [Pelagophyceae sp. CCMP2097]|nr:GrpE-domain-containing protein [Pelagophyceae sp. CCMP2097]|mmetsp:Transcript_9496/g.31398  ORF Transcript_9496/g.31398 Transcript_9496/m.31398 type:complete len:221 (+) Transcript_9496:18-680(+)
MKSGLVLSALAWSAGAFAPAVRRQSASTRRGAEEAEAAVDDITNSVIFLEKKLQVLEKESTDLDASIAEANALLEAGKAEWGPQIEKLQKEFDIVRQRTSEARTIAETTEKAKIVEQITPATDNLDRAFEFIKPKTDGERAIFERYEATVKVEFDLALKTLGVDLINEVGVKMDPELHSCAYMQPDMEIPEEHVAQILQKGYALGKSIIRPATVVVSSGI